MLLSNEYLAWNQAISEFTFNDSQAGLPVYLDLDDDKFDQIILHPALSGMAKSKSDLCRVVEETISWNVPGSSMFQDIMIGSQRWMRQFTSSGENDTHPPMIAFLAVAVLAAEEMGAGELSPNNYYRQLCKLLNVNPDDEALFKKLRTGYQQVVLVFWALLRKWLVQLEWTKGVPTAEQLSSNFPYVSVAISQALVRETDRLKFTRMFEEFRFLPGEQISPPDMQEYLNQWFMTPECSASAPLRNLWKRPSAAERISEVACHELELWNGQVFGGHYRGLNNTEFTQVNRQGRLRLAISISSYLGAKHLIHSLCIPSGNQVGESAGEYMAEGSHQPLHFQQATKNLATLENRRLVPLPNLLPGDLAITSTLDPEKTYRRQPRNIVPMVFDEELQAYLEVDKASIGKPMALFVRDEIELVTGVWKVLQENSRPGFIAEIQASGVPEGWILIRNVQLVSSRASQGEDRQENAKILNAILPTGSSQLLLSGGVKVPGMLSQKKYLIGHLPEVVAISQDQENVSLVLTSETFENDGLSETELAAWSSSNGTIFANLDDLALGDGEYRISFFEGKKLVSSRDLLVRSRNTPDLLAYKNRPALVHSFEIQGGDAAFSAMELTDDVENWINGAVSNYVYEQEEIVSEPQFLESAWEEPISENENGASEEAISIPEVSSTSCVYTGAHHRELGTCAPNVKFVVGICKNCGDVSTEYCDQYLARKRSIYTKLQQARHRTGVTPVKPEREIQADILGAIELVLCSISGKARSLLLSLEGLSGSDYNSRQLLELLEQLSIIEVTRDLSGNPELWAIVDTQIVISGNPKVGSFLGFWHEDAKHSLSGVNGVEINFDSPPCKFSSSSDVETLASALMNLEVEATSASKLLEILPDFSFVRNNIDLKPLVGFEGIEIFDVHEGFWRQADEISTGAVRLTTQYGRRHFFITEESISEVMGIPCSATVAKYLAANELGISLLTLDSTGRLFAPRGSSVPGIYGRVLLLASGQVPREVDLVVGGNSKTVLEYENVPKEIGQRLAQMLSA
jgi:hypothetical protein